MNKKNMNNKFCAFFYSYIFERIHLKSAFLMNKKLSAITRCLKYSRDTSV